MDIGIPHETPGEARVGLTPDVAAELIAAGHRVRVAAGAGAEAGFPDAAYAAAGVDVCASLTELLAASQLVAGAGPPSAEVCAGLRSDQTLVALLGLGRSLTRTEQLIAAGVAAFDYAGLGGRPAPVAEAMADVAGGVAAAVGLSLLLESGRLAGGVRGLPPIVAVVLGAGTAGVQAARRLAAHGADVQLLDASPTRLRSLALPDRVTPLTLTRAELTRRVPAADLLIADLPAQRAAVPRALVEDMAADAVVIETAIELGAVVESSRPTTRGAPVTVRHGVRHHALTGLAGLAARTASQALAQAALPWLARLACDGWRLAARDDAVAFPLELARGAIVRRRLAETFGLEAVDPSQLLDRTTVDRGS